MIIDGTNGLTFNNATTQASAGRILQVVQNTYSTQVSLSSTTYTDTGLSGSITPKFSTSSILVLISQNLYIYREFAFQYGYIQLLRNIPSANTVAKDFGQVMDMTAGNPAGGSYPYFDMSTVLGLSYLDSPATTSAITYKTQQKCGTISNGGTIIAQISSSPSMITLMEIAA
jgi:hypothetical protein